MSGPNDQERIEEAEFASGLPVPFGQNIATNPMAVVARAEELAKVRERIRTVAVRMTRSSDWRLWGDNPRPEDGAAADMLSVFGLQLSPPIERKIEREGEVIYQYKAMLFVPATGSFYPIMGTASTKDGFFWRNGVAQRPEDVDLQDVMKKALANTRVNAAVLGCGLKGITVEELGRLGIDAGKVEKVEFRGGSQGGGKPRAEASEVSAAIELFNYWVDVLEPDIDVTAKYFHTKKAKDEGKPPLALEEIRAFKTPNQVGWLKRVILDWMPRDAPDLWEAWAKEHPDHLMTVKKKEWDAEKAGGSGNGQTNGSAKTATKPNGKPKAAPQGSGDGPPPHTDEDYHG